MLLGIAVADDRLLDESRAVFVYLNFGTFGCQKNDASDLSEFKSDLHISRIEGFFNRTNIWLVTPDDGLYAVTDFQETRRESVARRSFDCSVFDEGIATRLALNHAPACRLAPRINS